MPAPESRSSRANKPDTGLTRTEAAEQDARHAVISWVVGNAEGGRPTCARCGGAVEGRMVTAIEGQNWHVDCFTCMKCNKALGNLRAKWRPAVCGKVLGDKFGAK